MPSILYVASWWDGALVLVLNLIITGMPSIHDVKAPISAIVVGSFKPYYNWNAFNTEALGCILAYKIAF